MHTNRLIHEKSPYLVQHAHNPVDWYPWGDEAFEKAREENKPIFLSIGYSTCHWCHVMERESFEDETVAEFLNRHFVPIKVDREERPDVDRIYMAFVQAATGGGGWPLSVWLTPDLKPFYGGTYYPPQDAYGRPGFLTVLRHLAQAWEQDRGRVVETAGKVLGQLEQQIAPAKAGGGRVGADVFDHAFQLFRRTFDPRHGGFGGAPKFPRPVTFNFLLRFHASTGNREALEMVARTLRAMAAGGIHDHIGGGYHRYAVDERWFVPHFEKMLYDQAQLAVSFTEAWQITGDEFYAGQVRDIVEYVLRDLRHPEGAFYSAEDADSVIDPAHPEKKGEGAFYVWTAEEISGLLGEPVAEWFKYRYGVESEGNVPAGLDPHGELAGKNILYEAHALDETAREFSRAVEEIERGLAEARRKLFEARARRVRPHRDEKVLVSWNGLMISALARAGRALDEPGYIEAAEQAARFLLDKMYDASTRDLRRRYCDGESAVKAFLDDYAALAGALFDLYEATFEMEFLETSVALAEALLERFEDREGGGFYATQEGDSSLLLRLKDDYDGAEPSGNSLSVGVLVRLAQLTGREDFRRSAERALQAFGKLLREQPVAAPQMLAAAMMLAQPPRQIVLAGEPGDPALEAMRREIGRRFLPGAVLLHAGGGRERLAAWQPAVARMGPVDGKPAAYVCENFTCRLPVTSVDALIPLLE